MAMIERPKTQLRELVKFNGLALLTLFRLVGFVVDGDLVGE
jgi:hypothetical protein